MKFLLFLLAAGSTGFLPPLHAQSPSETVSKQSVDSAKLLIEKMEAAKRPPTPLPWLSRPPKTPYPDPVVRVSDVSLQRFDTAFTDLCTHYGVSIFAEGTPLAPSLTKDELTKIKASLSAGGGATLSKAVITLAGAYDYEAFRTSEATFLLFKRYSSPNDLPFVTYDELLATCKNLKRISSTLDPHVTPPEKVDAPLLKLHTALHERYGEDRFIKGFPIAELPPDQQKILHDYAVYHYLAPCMEVAKINYDFLQASRSDTAVFRRVNLLTLDVPVLIYEGPFRLNRFHEYAISHGFTFQGGGTSSTRTKNRMNLTVSSISKPFPEVKYQDLARERITRETLPDPDAPSPRDYEPAAQPPSSALLTLQTLADRLNAAQKSDLKRIMVDETVAPKTLNVFNEGILAPEQALQNAAYLYGLRLQHRDNEETFLTLRAAVPARTLEEVAVRAEQVFPDPLRRALLKGAVFDETAQAAEEERKVAAGEKNAVSLWRVEIHNSVLKNRSESLCRAAVRRLRVLIEPKINAAPTQRYAMKDMTDEERGLFALIGFMESSTSYVRWIDSRPPRCLNDWQNALVRGAPPIPGMSPTETLFIGIKNENGSFVQDMAFYLNQPEFKPPPEKNAVP